MPGHGLCPRTGAVGDGPVPAPPRAATVPSDGPGRFTSRRQVPVPDPSPRPCPAGGEPGVFLGTPVPGHRWLLSHPGDPTRQRIPGGFPSVCSRGLLSVPAGVTPWGWGLWDGAGEAPGTSPPQRPAPGEGTQRDPRPARAKATGSRGQDRLPRARETAWPSPSWAGAKPGPAAAQPTRGCRRGQRGRDEPRPPIKSPGWGRGAGSPRAEPAQR